MATEVTSAEGIEEVRRLIKERTPDCYSVNVERDACSILLKRRESQTRYLTVARIRVSLSATLRWRVEEAIQKALGW